MENLSRQAETNILTYGANDEEEDSRRQGDPCFHYTVLDQAWRATNTTTNYKMCDRSVKWKGVYIPSVNAFTLIMNNVNFDVHSILHQRLVPSLLQGKEYSDAGEVCPYEQMWHTLPTVAGRTSPKEEERHCHPQCLWPLEEELLCFQIHPHPGQEVSWQLLCLQVHSADKL